MARLKEHVRKLLRPRVKINARSYRPLNTLALELNEQDVSHHRPYTEIPGPKPIPLLGNTWRFLPFVGNFDIQSIDKLSRRLHAEYGNIVKVEGLLGRPDMVFVYDANEIERIFRQEEKMPHRPSMPSLDYYKHVLRKDFFEENPGVIAVHGESWYNFRSKVQQIMLQPQSARMYVGEIEEASTAFLRRIRKIRNGKCEVPDDFLNEMHKWSLESIARVALDVRLGCLDDAADTETQKLINALITFFKNVPILELKIPFWKICNTPTWQEYVNALDIIVSTISKYTAVALSRTKNKIKSDKELSLLEKVLAQEGDTKVASTLALDLFLVGVDTTSTSVASVLYQLALHPEKQALAHEEICNIFPQKDAPIRTKDVDNLKYLRACIKETLRMYPVVIGNGRSITSDAIIGGYRVPKGVHVVFQHYVISNLEKYFPQSQEFLPERWLCKDGVRHRFASLPFGYGRRMCLGRRFAELEMIIVISKQWQSIQIIIMLFSAFYKNQAVPSSCACQENEILQKVQRFLPLLSLIDDRKFVKDDINILQCYKIEYRYKRLEYYINPMYTPRGPLRLRFIER